MSLQSQTGHAAQARKMLRQLQPYRDFFCIEHALLLGGEIRIRGLAFNIFQLNRGNKIKR